MTVTNSNSLAEELDNKQSARLIIGADLVPTKSNAMLFSDGDCSALVGEELLNLINSADFSIFNLETPLSDIKSPIMKCGPCLVAPTATVKGLSAISPHAFTLANNHIMDQGVNGLMSTMKTLDSAGLQYFGAGRSLAEANEPLVISIAGTTVGLYGCVEHEFSVAGKSSPGAAPYDPLESFDHVKDLASHCNYTVVLYHGGKEHFRYPSPELRRRCRKFAECGADLVVCQHSHCVGCKEEWAGSTLVYGQGNFLFDHSSSEYWKTGLLIEVELLDEPKIKYHPIVKDAERVRMAHGDKASEILSSFNDRSREIVEPGYVEQKYTEYAMTYIDSYLASCIPGSRTIIFRVLNKLCGGTLPRKLLGKEKLLSLLNHIECEAHSELGIAGLRALTNTGQAC